MSDAPVPDPRLESVLVTACSMEVPLGDFCHLPQELGCALERTDERLTLASEQPGLPGLRGGRWVTAHPARRELSFEVVEKKVDLWLSQAQPSVVGIPQPEITVRSLT